MSSPTFLPDRLKRLPSSNQASSVAPYLPSVSSTLMIRLITVPSTSAGLRYAPAAYFRTSTIAVTIGLEGNSAPCMTPITLSAD